MALLVGAVMSIAAYSLGSGTTTVTLLSLALIALALAQVAGMMRSYISQGVLAKLVESQTDVAEQVKRVSNESRRINFENENLARNVEQFRFETSALNISLSESLAALRESHETTAESLRAILSAQRDIQSTITSQTQQAALNEAIAREQMWLAQVTEQQTPAPEVVATAPAAPDFQQSGLAETSTMSLEPIVDLFTSNTAHYRMMLGMTNDQGHDVEHDVFMHHVDRIGMRVEFDQYVVEQSLELVSQLRQRDPNLCVFVSLGSATLASVAAVSNIIAMLQQNTDQSHGVVLDMPHAVLASLSQASLEGLATFARAGVPLSLSQASISGIDLAALNSLNVRWVGLSASSVGVGGNISAGLPGFVQSARALRIQIIISQVGDPRHVQGLSRTARFASGPAFAMPSKLKRTLPDTPDYTAAA
jgi:EAL domain-containing protein (putative c-di-GMP-specific phosphodiesterase class I)